MAESNRVNSIDIMRGLDLILMLFVNDLYMPGVPAWLGHRAADFDGMGLADWVFPGFMFMVGMAIPFSFGSRIAKGENKASVLKHILIRSASLLVIGLLMANSRNVGGDFTGFSKNIWSMITYAGVFFIWNNYRKTPDNSYLINSLKILGIVMIIPMVYLFRSPQNAHFSFHSWGILGTIGWGYLAASLIYVAAGEKLLFNGLAMAGFLALNILSKLHLLDFLNPVRPLLGPLLNGNAPFIVISGLFTSLILKKYSGQEKTKPLPAIIVFGLLSLAGGFILRHWFLISKIQATPSWALVCNGISLLLFACLYTIIDILNKGKWAVFMKPAGANSLTVYLVPDMFYYIIWQLSLPLLFYKNSGMPAVVILGSVAWALVMGVALPVFLERINFRLKL
jgi:heparan-alpha-glucosaminide N-acetyltransferase